MKIQNMNKLFYLFAALFLVNSCVKDDDYGLPPYEAYVCNDDWTTNTTIEEVIAEIGDAGLYTFEDGDTENVFEGYVISSDETGNFYKTISIQNDTVSPTRGIQIELNQTNLFNNFPLGSKVRVLLNGINGGIVNSVYKVGGTYGDGVGQLDEYLIPEHVKRACEDLQKITPVTYTDISDLTQTENLNTLIKLEGVQFITSELGLAYTSGDAATNRTIIDPDGNEITLRTSSFANFAADILPEGSGSITAVLSKYNSEWQMFIRDTNDVVFDQERFDDGYSENGGPIGGSDTTYQACINEGFSDYDTYDTEFPQYINDATSGLKYWEVRSFDGNSYIQLSAHNSTDTSNEAYFIVPVDFSNADTFSFKTKDGYNNGDPLTVFYSTDYTLGGDISAATLNDITSSFTISTGNTDGYGTSFVASGDYDLSSISGEGVIVFKYTGAGSGITTTMQIDDISVTDNDDADCGGSSEVGGGIGGEDATYNNCLNETIDGYAEDVISFSKYENYAYEGDRYWIVEEYNSNKYLKMNAFSGEGAYKTYFIVPVDFTNADSFSFKTKDGYNNGDALKVYYSMDYTIGSDISTATLVDITSNFTISTGNTSGYGASFIDSGSYDLSSLSGNGVILFYYEGDTDGITTTMQIDEISITDNEDPDCGGSSGTEGLAFPGGDFEDWSTFLGGLNSFGLKDYATENIGNGVDGSTALGINMDSTANNDYVFTALASSDLPSSYSSIKFYVKGTSDKSISINLYNASGDNYYRFNLGDITGSATIAPSGSNQYSGVINTNGEWAEITLDLGGITDLNTSNTSADFFALKIGKEVPYDLYLDNFTIQ